MAQVIQRALIIIVVAGALGLLANAVSPRGVPLRTPPKKAPKAEEFIPLPEAHQLWTDGAAFFLDARKPADFEAGHIANALSLPVEDFGEYYPKLAPMLPPDNPVVVYCDGTECELSHKLADQLRAQGYAKVHILFNGWSAWRAAGFSTATGPAQ